MPQCVQNTFKNDVKKATIGQPCAPYRRQVPALPVVLQPAHLHLQIMRKELEWSRTDLSSTGCLPTSLFYLWHICEDANMFM